MEVEPQELQLEAELVEALEEQVLLEQQTLEAVVAVVD
jgi:hypothetical protein